jgi:hypothetical protein
MKTSVAVFVLALASLCALPASAQLYTGTALQNSGGNIARIVPFAPVTVCVASDTAVPCTSKAATFTDSTLGTPCTLGGGNGAPLSGTGCNNPGIADANGNFTFFAASGNYRICTFAQNYQCSLVSTGGLGGINCPVGSVALPYFNGTITVCDSNANFDGNVTWTFENINSPGTITGGTIASTGPGGILDLQLQTPPASVPAGHAYVYANSVSGLLDCLKNGLVECFSFLQVIASGTASLSTSSVSSGGCNVTTVAATGITTSSKIVATPNVDPTGVTGYGPSASGSLYVQAWPTANNINFKVCNNTGSPITPGALTLDYAAFFIHIVLLHAQIGSGLPLMGSTQGSPAAPTATAFRPIVLTVAATNAAKPKPVILVPGNPIIIH